MIQTYAKKWQVVGINPPPRRMPMDTGMLIVVLIIMVYLTLIFGMLFKVNNNWCHLLFKNGTVIKIIKKKSAKRNIQALRVAQFECLSTALTNSI